jgi:mannosyl-3-phosphoglycerate phosphatase family protein
MNETKPVIIISDLDGTLLDHENYQFDSALPALGQIKQKNIPLILNSSKTAAEIIQIRKTLDNHYPFVVENGAGIYLPTEKNKYEIISFGKDRKGILVILKELKEKLNVSFSGFNDMSIDELVANTGLTKEQAELAKQRDFTEPLKWLGSEKEWQLFSSELDKAGLTSVRGGRFISISGKVDKGRALSWLREYYQKHLFEAPVVIALGDSENDRAMLEKADYAVLIKSPVHEFPDINSEQLIRTTEYGPQGWNNSIIKLLNTLYHGKHYG